MALSISGCVVGLQSCSSGHCLQTSQQHRVANFQGTAELRQLPHSSCTSNTFLINAALLKNAYTQQHDRAEHNRQRTKQLKASFLGTGLSKSLHTFGTPPTRLQRKSARKHPTSALLKPFISQATTDKTIQLPINYYQVLQADKLSLPDKIVKAYETRVRDLPGDGAPYSKAALAAREELLLIARNLLVNSDARRSYNLAVQNNDVGLVEVPWSQLPGALALLQEVGEEDVVLEVGRAALAERPPNRVFRQDIALAMALSLVELARESVGESPPAFARGCEQLERALEILKEEGGKGFALELQDDIDNSLARLAPYCVLDLLSKPLNPEHASARREGLAGVRQLLQEMAEPESRWRHPDVMSRADFARSAFEQMTVAEQVELYKERCPDTSDSFPELLTSARAHIAEGFMHRKPELVEDADTILSELARELQQDPDSADNQRHDVALERAMCCLLLGRVEEAKTYLGLHTTPPTGDPNIAEYVYTHSGSTTDLLPGLCSLTERWLGEALLVSYREASGLSPAITPYFEDPHVKAHLERLQQGSVLLVLGRFFKSGYRLAARVANLPVKGVKWVGKGVEGLVSGLATGLRQAEGSVRAAASGTGVDNDRPSVRSALAMGSINQSWETVNSGTVTGTGSQGALGLGYDLGLEGEPITTSDDGQVSKRGPMLPPKAELAKGVSASGHLKDLDLESVAQPFGREVLEGSSDVGLLRDNPDAGDLSLAQGPLLGLPPPEVENRVSGATNNGAASSKASPFDPVYRNRSNLVIAAGGVLLLAAVAATAFQTSTKPSSKPPTQTVATVTPTRPIAPKPTQPIIPKVAPVEIETRMPPMDSVLAEGIIRRWQKAKAGALGRRADVAGLADVLDGSMLTEWTAKARDFHRAGKRWEYDLRGISVESVRVSNRGREAAVEVTLQERAIEYDSSHQQIESYEDEYRAKYDLKFVRGAGWRIVSGTVLG